jgi:hypothetical protein
MGNIDEQILRATKEIVVKFIEAGRISPSGFHETFKDIYHTVEKTTKESIKRSSPEVGTSPEKTDKPEKKKKMK